MKKIIAIIIFICVPMLFAKNAECGNFYILPKMSFNYPIKGGDFSLGFGGGLGYWIQPYMAMETTYLRVLGNKNAPDNHTLEFDSIFQKSMNKVSLFFQIGSGLCYITGTTSDGSDWLADFGMGFSLNFIPTLNLRISSIYYVLFNNKDQITGQFAILLSF